MYTWKTIYLSLPLLQIFSTRNNSRFIRINRVTRDCIIFFKLPIWPVGKFINIQISRRGGGERSPFFHQAKTNRENFVDSLNHGQPFLRLMKPFIDSQPINRPYNMKICTGKQQQVCACALAPARMQTPRLVVAADRKSVV